MTTFQAQRRVEFVDTDAAGIAHFSAFLIYMEQTEHEFLRSLGLSVVDRDAEGPYSWPRVSVACDFHGAVRFEDLLDIELSITRLGDKSVSYAFDFRHAGRLVATGRLTAVCCRIVDGQIASIPIPATVRAKLEPWWSGA